MNIAHDPAFVAIERHRAALTALNSAFELESEAKIAADANPALLPAAHAADLAEKAAWNALEDARAIMGATKPGTAQGAAAIINYILDGMALDDAEELRDYEKAALRNVAACLAKLPE